MVICETCVNRTDYDKNNNAECIVFGMRVYKGCRGCEYWESNPKLKRSEDGKPKVPSVNEFGVLIKYNIYEHNSDAITLKIKVGEVYGKWYGGCSWTMHGLNYSGGGYAPCVRDIAFPTERDAINHVLKRLLCTVENDNGANPKAAEFIRSLMMDQRQLSLFD